ncbi:SRPBCC family protein [Nakamurella leprariae]|uniref:SRPBCC family protein n=1 Tax=Nakamurella leprariae TaxID=2803911 RepID=A0A939BVA5_9ACTN|nr:SRPBCC family protein [Nakamurella leprariae]MBM9466328.1 SRPBCC family protein [Nakamurella leprariae]
MTVDGTGRVETTGGTRRLVIEREFRASPEVVLACLTESPRLGRWIGIWSGTGGPGRTVQFVMTAEGATEPQPVTIAECRAPHRLVVDFEQDQDAWHLELDLAAVGDGGTTRLVFVQRLDFPGLESSVGPGWEYYLERLGAALAATPEPDWPTWDDYWPHQQAHYGGADPTGH